MAPLAANDVYTWVPPTPAAVIAEAGYVPAAANVGAFCPINTMYWTSQTYLSYATAGYSQTYDTKAPATPVLRADATDDQDEEKPKPKPKTPAKAPAKKAEKQ